jgi:hypothetical protein
MSLTGCLCILGCAAIFTIPGTSAQSATPTNQINASESPAGESSSLQLAEAALPASSAALPSAPAPASAGGQQDQSQTQTYSGLDLRHRLTMQFGVGANAPAGDKTYITWGWQFTLGGGFNINQHLAAMIDYQFMSDKVPGAIIAESGTTGGHYHIWSFTLDPVVDLFPKSANDLYVTGGGGFYRKTTNFTVLSEQEFCYYFCYNGYAPTTVGKLSSNQGGFEIGGGYQHRFGGMYGLSRTRFFAGVTYVDVLSPALRGTTPSGGLSPVTIAADTKVLPITLGIRW